jgi:hypothetical protein
VGGAFDGAVKVDAVIGRSAVTAHGEAGRTDGDTLLIDLVGIARRAGRSVTRVEDDNRIDLFGEQILVITAAIVTGIVDGGGDDHFQLAFLKSFDEPIEALERESEIGFVSLTEAEMDGQIVTAEIDDVFLRLRGKQV